MGRPKPLTHTLGSLSASSEHPDLGWVGGAIVGHQNKVHMFVLLNLTYVMCSVVLGLCFALSGLQWLHL